jgi:hypothetical protein
MARGLTHGRIARTGVGLVYQLVDAVKPVAVVAVPELVSLY